MQNNILLIVPDKKEQVALLHKLQADHKIYVAKSTVDVAQSLQNNFIQLVFCSVLEINGWEVCEQIKSSFHFSHIPVVLLAHDHNLQLQVKSLDTGADALVSSSMPANYLLALIRNLVINRIRIAKHYTCVHQNEIVPEPEDDFIKKLHGCIAGNIHNKVLSVDLLASIMNMSRPTLYRKIKTITNQTPNELIALARLKQAAVLLATANYKVFEVAEMVGFSSPSGFGKAFLKQFKVTPVAYQRINRETSPHGQFSQRL